MGLDLSKGIIRNNLEYGVIEPAMSKVKIIQVGTLVSFLVMLFYDAKIIPRFIHLPCSSPRKQPLLL
jgi:hypothetical protein